MFCCTKSRPTPRGRLRSSSNAHEIFHRGSKSRNKMSDSLDSFSSDNDDRIDWSEDETDTPIDNFKMTSLKHGFRKTASLKNKNLYVEL